MDQGLPRAKVRRGPARELALAALAACALAVVMHWPLLLHLGRDVPRDVYDPLLQAWQVAWGGHALAHQPLDLFQANTYWPLPNSLAFSDALAGYAPAGLIGSGPEAALVRYNLLFLFSYALAFLGAYLLARELGTGPIGGAVAGAAFAYAPWRLDQDGHLHVLSSGGIPLSLFLLVRGYRRRRPGLILAGWIVAAWQLLLGFTLGLQLAYLLGALALLAGVVWLRRRPVLGRRVLAASAAGVAVAGVAVALLARPYLEVADDHPEARPSKSDVATFSPPLWSYLAAPEGNLIWGRPTRAARDRLLTVSEQTLFPGLTALALAATGLLAGTYRRRLRVGLAAGGAACAVLAHGLNHARVRLPLQPYELLYEYGPGWDGIRTPGRINTLTSLALALLAAAGAHAVLRAAERRRPNGARARLAAMAAGGVMVGVILVEGAGFKVDERGELLAAPPHPRVPFPPAGQRDAGAPQLHLPFLGPSASSFVFWSTDGFPAIVNGRGSFEPRQSASVYRRVRRFPDRGSVRRLRAWGVRTVILHPDLAAGTPWGRAHRKPVGGLPLRRERRGRVVLYHLSTL